MAANTNPIFGLIANVGVGAVATANTNRDGTGTIVTIFTAGTNGSRINEIVMKATSDPADSVVVLFLYNGSTYYVYDEFDLGDPAAGSTTAPSFRYSRTYQNLVLPTGWSLRASITVAPTAGNVNVFAFGADF